MTGNEAAERIVVIGGGGHAKVVIDAARLAGLNPIAVLDADPHLMGLSLLDVPVVGDDERLSDYPPGSFRLAMGVGGARLPEARIALFRQFGTRGYRFAAIVHPGALVAADVEIGDGAQIMAGAVVQTGTRICPGALINTRASVDHDCTVGAFAHLGPGVVLCGNVSIGEGTLIGAGATITPGLSIGAGVVVGAGAAVTRNVADGERVGGVPARDIRRGATR
jgi:sugar O-acyltransferase (sialic acid O-acetyltransferase NeuD family)